MRLLKPGEYLRKFSIFDLVIIAISAAIGVAIKPVIVPLVQIVSGPLFIPGGAIAGGFYMMWLVIGAGLVGKRGVATLIAIVQALLVLATGIVGTHGIMTLATYIVPGIAIDLLLLATRQYAQNIFSCFFAGLIANAAGTFLTNFVFFRLPAVPLVLTIAAGALSGGSGGLIAYGIIKGFSKIKIPGMNMGREQKTADKKLRASRLEGAPDSRAAENSKSGPLKKSPLKDSPLPEDYIPQKKSFSLKGDFVADNQSVKGKNKDDDNKDDDNEDDDKHKK